MNILLTNDDGIEAIGIQTLAKKLSEKNTVYIVAPDRQRSGSSQSATYFFSELTIKKYNFEYAEEAYSVSGTPADCVYVALNCLFKNKIDLVISGINHGPNVSLDCYYSGTIGGAREALFLKVPSIAVSLWSKEDGFYEASKVVEELIPIHMENENKLQYILNVNVPYNKEGIKGMLVTSLEKDWKFINEYKKIEIAENNFKIKITGKEMHGNILTDEVIGDASACHNGYVSVTPLSIDMDAREFQKELAAQINTKKNKKFKNCCCK